MHAQALLAGHRVLFHQTVVGVPELPAQRLIALRTIRDGFSHLGLVECSPRRRFVRFLSGSTRKWSPFPLHSLPRNGSALRVLTDSSVLRYMEYSSDLPQAVAYGGAIVPCIYTLHRVESLVRFHYTLPVFCEAPLSFVVPPSS